MPEVIPFLRLVPKTPEARRQRKNYFNHVIGPKKIKKPNLKLVVNKDKK